MLTDFYIMLVASGTISDLQIHWLTSHITADMQVRFHAWLRSNGTSTTSS